jgi:hypothetical protein
MFRRFFTVACASLLAAASIPSHALTTFSTTEYTVVYDEVPLGTIQSWNESFFSWTIPTSVNVSTFGAGTAAFNLPSFTLTPNAGYTLSSTVGGFIGNFTYTAVFGGTAAADVTGNVAINGGAAAPLSLALIADPIANSGGGILSANPSYNTGVGSIASLSFSSGVLTLTTVANGGFANILAQPQNKFEISFSAVAVPEPESYAMFFAGLGLIGAIVRRRTQSI